MGSSLSDAQSYARGVARERGLSNQPRWLTAKEAAARLGVQTRTVYAYASRGLLGSTSRGPGKESRYALELVESLKKKAAARSGHGAVAASALRWGEPVLDSAITALTPRGPVYRGARAIELLDTPWERVAERLWNVGPLDWSRRCSRHPGHAPRPSLQALLEVVVHHAARLRSMAWTECVPLINRLACAVGPHEAEAELSRSVAEHVFTSLTGRDPKPDQLAVVNAALVLIADHELNASTFAARVAASAGAPWVDCLTAALATATGVRHASACDEAEALWRRMLETRSLKRWVASVARQGPMAGFDAGAYPQGDPRAQALLTRVRPLLSAKEDHQLSAFLAAVDDETNQLPSIDLALVIASHALGFPKGSATLLFVMGRTCGWVAHVIEQHADAAPIRPRARFTGR